MATILLQAAGAYLGGLIGGIGATLGTAAGALAGYAIDRALLNGSARREGPRLDDPRPFSAEEGIALPRVYGTVRIGGNLIWATRFEETRQTTRQGAKGGPRSTTYSYFANAAFAICEGEIAGVRRIWADGREIDQSEIEVRIHRGTGDQEPDPLIEAKQGSGGAPAYRGTAYAVFERFPVGPYGNRIPQFQFEVMRTVGDLPGRVRAVAMIPGSTEYGLAPGLVTRQRREGETLAVNRHVLHGATDMVASLDELQALCPNLEHIALVVSWFGDDLRAGACRIRPAVTGRDETGLSQDWVVSGVARGSAVEVSRRDGRPAFGGTPSDRSVMDAIAEIRGRGLKVTLYPFVMMDIPPDNAKTNPYGGGPEQPVNPWRGRITATPAPGYPGSADKSAAARSQIAAFAGGAVGADFSAGAETVTFASDPEDWGYRRLVLHYARLAAAAGGVDAFLVGSELRGLTTLRDGAGAFPFVECLCDLVAESRAILGSSTRISYAADWSEYFGHQPADGTGDVFYHLDPLWAHPEVDAVCIDNYMPISDWRDEDRGGGNPDGFIGPYDIEGLKRGIAGGEGFDWYYAGEEQRAARNRSPVEDGAYGKNWVFRYKDLVAWWSSLHHERPGGVEEHVPTSWTPMSKPIWFTELGSGAVDKGPNQPNVFPDPNSAEDAVPHFSNAARSDLAALRFLRAHLDHWDGSAAGHEASLNPMSPVYDGPMVDPGRIYLWAWDARPFPAFPARTDIWSDGGNWQRGHWLNGRLGVAEVGELVNAILIDHGLAPARTDQADGTMTGYVTLDATTARDLIEPVAGLFGLSATEGDAGLVFATQGTGSVIALTEDDLVVEPGRPTVERSRQPDHVLPREAVLGFRDEFGDYRPVSARTRTEHGRGSGVEMLALPAVLSAPQGEALVDAWLERQWRGRETVSFQVPVSHRAVKPGALVSLPGGAAAHIVTEIEDGAARRVSARRIAGRDASGWKPVLPDLPAPVIATAGRPLAIFLDLPMGTGGGAEEDQLRLAVRSKPWRAHVSYASPEMTGFSQRRVISKRAVTGRLAYPNSGGVEGRLNRANPLYVILDDGALSSVSRLQLLNGANMAALNAGNGEWEVIQFEQAEEVAPSTWRLDTMLRGQFGTGDAMHAGAAAGASFVLLDEAVDTAGLAKHERGILLNWRIGPSGYGLTDVNVATRQVAGGIRAARPLSPVHLRAVHETGTGIRLRWIRRGRIDADSWLPIEIPLGEEGEAYAVTVRDADGATIRSASSLATEWLYPSTAMAHDGVSGPADLMFEVCQTSSLAGPGLTARVSFHLG